MTSSSSQSRPTATARPLARLAPLSLLLIPALYLATMARTLVLGDPTEYTFVANILGIAHPPGYAFITLAGHLFQRLIPFGDYPWRMHLLAVTAGSLAAIFVYAIVAGLQRAASPRRQTLTVLLPPLLAGFGVATAVNHWQHAIHANPHIITAAFLGFNLLSLTRWASRQAGATGGPADRWLFAFCLSAGLGVTHHPLTVFAFPAYALFLLAVRPAILRDWRTLLKMVAFALLGLSAWLYFPIRSPMAPPFGPADMNSLDGFLSVTLARNLRVNLFHYGLADQPLRALVFWSLLRLQYGLPTITLALIGAGWLAAGMPAAGTAVTGRPARLARALLLLYGGAFLGTYVFVINSVQDVMAYLNGPFLIVGLLAGIGLWGLLALARQRLGLGERALALLAVGLFLIGPAAQLARNLPRVSLREYDQGVAYVTAVFDQFPSRGEGAVLLNDWEHMTPLWYNRYVADRWPDPADVRPEFVSSARPWLPSVFDYLPGGPVYLNGYRAEIVAAGFRLRPRGPFYQVVEPGDDRLPPEITAVAAAAGDLRVEGYALPRRDLTAGDFVPLVLAFSAPTGTADYYAPVLHVGQLRFEFTTDSHLITPLWQPGEIIVERFDFALPHDLPAGDYPLRLDLKNLSRDALVGPELPLGQLSVSAAAAPPRTDHLLANFRQRVGLAGASARAGGWLTGKRRQAPWSEPLAVRPGDTVQLTLDWLSLARAEESYTVFVHLIDAGNQIVAPPLDYTPLGGAAPTHLWIPKWLPGQRYLDPYRMVIPAGLPAGVYFVEVGLYEMTSGRRLHIADPAGNLAGDRYILGGIEVDG